MNIGSEQLTILTKLDATGLLNIVMIKYLIIIFILFFSCNKNPSSVSNIPNPPREYKWTLDTLSIPNTFQISMNDIWGSSAEDVYVAGHSSGARGKMFHYDGKETFIVGDDGSKSYILHSK